MPRYALRIVVAVSALCILPVLAGAQTSLAGSWRGVVQLNGIQCVFDRVITPTGTYSETERCGPYATSQSGTYTAFPNQTVSFTVTDWTPKRRYVVGAVPGTGHYEDNARPPGGTFHYTFTSPDSMVWRDVHFGGTIVYRRTR